jgi:predicted DNA-binding protein (UPF0251 family)
MDQFYHLCKKHGLTDQIKRANRLDLFDKLGLVIHFPNIPTLDALLLNPEWLTYGVYRIMFSDEAREQQGCLSTQTMIDILGAHSVKDRQDRTLSYPASRCNFIFEAMEQFKVAFRPAQDRNKLVIPALLGEEQPQHSFSFNGAWAFRLRCEGFLPRHVLPSVMADRYWDIAGKELWQFGAHFRSGHDQAEAFVQADYHTRTITIWVRGRDGRIYLGILREIALRALEEMKHIKFFEEVELTGAMRLHDSSELMEQQAESVWVSYDQIKSVARRPGMALPAPDGEFYDLSKINGLPATRDVAHSLADMDRILQEIRVKPPSAGLKAVEAEVVKLRDDIKTTGENATPEERKSFRDRLTSAKNKLHDATKAGDSLIKWGGWLVAIFNGVIKSFGG